jgi:hypothetical protein
MQRLTWDGIAIHAGHLPGFPASHGCIRVPLSFAQTLFAMTALGNSVSVDDWPPHTPAYLDIDWRRVTDLTPPAPSSSTAERPFRLDYDLRVIAFKTGA